MKTPLIWTLAYLVCATLCQGSSDSLQQTPQPSEIPPQDQEVIRAMFVKVPFTLSETGHQVITAECKGQKLLMVLDTGAGLNVISDRTANRLGLKAEQKGAKVEGLGTADYSMAELPPIPISIGGHQLTMKHVSAIDLQHVETAAGTMGTTDGLIGLPFCLMRHARIDYAKKELSFLVFPDLEQAPLNSKKPALPEISKQEQSIAKSPATTPPPSVEVRGKTYKLKTVTAAFTLSESGHQVITADYKGETLQLIIDSAAGVNVLANKTAKRLGFDIDHEGTTVGGLGTSAHTMVGLPGFPLTIAGERVIMTKTAAMDLHHVETAAGKEGTDGLIGLPFLLQRSARIDFGKQELSFIVVPEAEQKRLPSEQESPGQPAGPPETPEETPVRHSGL